MKKKPSDQRDWHERRIEEARIKGAAASNPPGRAPSGAPESPESRETFPRRTKKPGEAGLANEARPGLGTRRDDPAEEGREAKSSSGETESDSRPEATERGYEEPRPAPREQPADSLEHEQERSTGVSGQSSGG